MSPDQQLLEWKAMRPENIPEALATYAPVRWTCLVAETHIL